MWSNRLVVPVQPLMPHGEPLPASLCRVTGVTGPDQVAEGVIRPPITPGDNMVHLTPLQPTVATPPAIPQSDEAPDPGLPPPSPLLGSMAPALPTILLAPVPQRVTPRVLVPLGAVCPVFWY